VAYSVSPSSTFWSFWATDNVQGHSADLDPYTLTVAITQTISRLGPLYLHILDPGDDFHDLGFGYIAAPSFDPLH
jgi:hypothetical protein